MDVDKCVGVKTLFKERYPRNCPHCGVSLDDGDVYERMLESYGEDKDGALEAAMLFGWSENNPVRFSKIMGMYSVETDRTEYYACPYCMQVISLKDGD